PLAGPGSQDRPGDREEIRGFTWFFTATNTVGLRDRAGQRKSVVCEIYHFPPGTAIPRPLASTGATILRAGSCRSPRPATGRVTDATKAFESKCRNRSQQQENPSAQGPRPADPPRRPHRHNDDLNDERQTK